MPCFIKNFSPESCSDPSLFQLRNLDTELATSILSDFFYLPIAVTHGFLVCLHHLGIAKETIKSSETQKNMWGSGNLCGTGEQQQTTWREKPLCRKHIRS